MPLTVQGSVTMRITKDSGYATGDQIYGITTATYGGTLVITNVTSDGTPLASGDTFTLFNASTGTGNFTSIVGSPGAGLAYSFNPATGVLSVGPGPTPQPYITSISISGVNLTLTGTNGTASTQYRVLTSTNVALPMASWTPVYTNTFPGDSFSLVIPVTPGSQQQFYRISIP
jgi:hypothetical protein